MLRGRSKGLRDGLMVGSFLFFVIVVLELVGMAGMVYGIVLRRRLRLATTGNTVDKPTALSPERLSYDQPRTFPIDHSENPHHFNVVRATTSTLSPASGSIRPGSKSPRKPSMKLTRGSPARSSRTVLRARAGAKGWSRMKKG